MEIDILQIELDNDLPYWLDSSEKNKELLAKKLEEIRAKHRNRYLLKLQIEKEKNNDKATE